MVIEFEIAGLPKQTNQNTGHWRRKMAEAVKWKTAVAVAVAKLRPPKPLNKARITFVRCSTKQPDFDGLVSGFKHVLDGLVIRGVLVNDTHAVIGQPSYSWEYARPGHGKIKIKVESIQD